MKYRSFAIFACLISLLALGPALISCNDGGQEQDAPTTATGAADRTAEPPRGSAAEPEAEPGADDPAEAEDAPSAAEDEPSVFVDGKGVYKAANCEMCHGKELQGTKLAPALADLAENWDAESLIEYMHDPEGYTENDIRLKTNAMQYKLPMPDWEQTGLGEPDLRLLVDWLLEQE